jgi:hypothetical protein
VRRVADEDPVAPDHVARVPHDRPHVLLVADVHEAADVEPPFDQRVAEPVHGIPSAGLLGDAASVHDDERPVHRDTVVPVRARHLQLSPHSLAHRRVAQPLERRRRAALVHPAREQRVERRRAREVRVRVERDVHT